MDEHQRHARYLLEFANVAEADEPDLIHAVLTDPDQVMAESAVVWHLDLRAAILLASLRLPAWAARVASLVEGHRFPERRPREWVLLRTVTLDEIWCETDLTGASDWLQRRACAEPATPAALTLLAERGRTRRGGATARTTLERV